MTDDQGSQDRPERAVLNGVLALVGVALVVGLILAGVALIATRMLGLSGDDASADAGETAKESLYLPPPQKTTDSGPEITLNTEDADVDEPTDEATTERTKPTESESAKEGEISLQALQSEVAAGENIDLTGVYPGGEGAILQVQRFEGGAWADFDATIPVSNETFSTYIFTGVTGTHRFRVIDNASGTSSNEVKVTVR
ncbi:putative small lipoprotein YifL [Nocardioides thalensis]|uniref:Putative small lipoprotein YifL n=1 Tax=Nocardioides thalensis TaxID=1914755 RepID=A0A853C737_9ACTN|nr:hypothetical protein [Nocardioides thalensis]NYJ03049.1 putative small lipoprotein YifL [Nocardioides thalensis]